MTMKLTRMEKGASRMVSLELIECPKNIGRLFGVNSYNVCIYNNGSYSVGNI